MKKRSDPRENWNEMRNKIIGLGDHSIRKSYYPELRKQVAELELLRNLLSGIINSMPSVLIGVDPVWKVIQWNAESQRVTGISASDAQGRHLAEVFPQLYEMMDPSWVELKHSPEGQPWKLTLEVEDYVRQYEVSLFPLEGSTARGGVIRMDDITERLSLEEAVIQSEKLISLGRLSAGMAHEINNPLAGILQNAQVIRNRLLNQDLPANCKAALDSGVPMASLDRYLGLRHIPELLDSVLESGRRAARIVSNMLSFSRKSTSDFQYHAITELLDVTVELAENDYDMKKNLDFRRISISREYEAGLPDIFCESSKIQQVFFNILRNGAQAMMGAGITHPAMILRCYIREGNVCVEIEDNGPGIPEAIRNRIFDPFFTTKSVGKGSGLGLYVSYCIIREIHGGTLSVSSVPGSSTTFAISLPVEHGRGES